MRCDGELDRRHKLGGASSRKSGVTLSISRSNSHAACSAGAANMATVEANIVNSCAFCHCNQQALNASMYVRTVEEDIGIKYNPAKKSSRIPAFESSTCFLCPNEFLKPACLIPCGSVELVDVPIEIIHSDLERTPSSGTSLRVMPTT